MKEWNSYHNHYDIRVLRDLRFTNPSLWFLKIGRLILSHLNIIVSIKTEVDNVTYENPITCLMSLFKSLLQQVSSIYFYSNFKVSTVKYTMLIFTMNDTCAVTSKQVNLAFVVRYVYMHKREYDLNSFNKIDIYF